MSFINNNTHKDLITKIFCIIDDLLKMTCPKTLSNKAWRKSSLSSSEVITITLFWKLLWYTKLKWIYWHMRNYFSKFFKMPSYKTFVTLSNKCAVESTKCLSILMNMNQRNATKNLYFIDSSKIAVCWNKRIFKHRVAKWFAKRWKSTMWWFFGFKLHIITDEKWNLVRIKVTSGNTDDRNPVLSLTKKLTGLLVWDAWYVWEELRKKLLKRWVHFVTWMKRNMKKLMTRWEHKLLKSRQIVESAFSVMKWNNNLESSFARSVDWHFARIVYSLLAYTVWKQLNNQGYLIS